MDNHAMPDVKVLTIWKYFFGDVMVVISAVTDFNCLGLLAARQWHPKMTSINSATQPKHPVNIFNINT